MAITVNASLNILTVEDVRSRLNEKSVEAMNEIVTDNTNRHGYKNDTQLLAKGIFYGEEYFDALKETNQTPRLDHFKKIDAFYHGFTSTKHFDMVADAAMPSGKKIGCFTLKAGVFPSEALQAMKEGLSLLGCGEVCQIAQYTAIECVLGRDKFNALFASNSPTPLMIGSSLPKNPISKLRLYLLKENASESEIKKGDLVFIKNTKNYLLKHPIGGAHGYNAICADDTIGSQKFNALGFSPNGMPRDQIQDNLISEYNRPFKRFETLTEKTRQNLCQKLGEKHLSIAQQMQNVQISPEEFRQENGDGNIQIVCVLDAERITALANSNLGKARKLLNGYDVRTGSR